MSNEKEFAVYLNGNPTSPFPYLEKSWAEEAAAKIPGSVVVCFKESPRFSIWTKSDASMPASHLYYHTYEMAKMFITERMEKSVEDFYIKEEIIETPSRFAIYRKGTDIGVSHLYYPTVQKAKEFITSNFWKVEDFDIRPE